MAKPSLTPGPRGVPLLGSLPELRRDPLGLLQGAMRDHGDIACIRMGPRNAYFLSHPDDIQRVLQMNHRNYGKATKGIDKLREILGNGLFTSDGSFWLKQRRLMQPAFERQRIAGFAATMAHWTGETLDRWERDRLGTPFDIHAQMMAVTLQIVAETMFGADMRDEAQRVGAAIDTALRVWNRRFSRAFNLPQSWPLPENVEFRKAVAVLDTVVQKMIEARRHDQTNHSDLLAILVALTDLDTGERMSDSQLRDEVLTIFGAGHETTAGVLSFALYLLATHPDVQERVREEVRRACGSRTPGAEDVKALEFTTMALRESMRLYPTAWIFGRNMIEADTLGGREFPGGTWVIMSAFVTHRRPDFWDAPEEYRPERMAPEAYDKLHRFAYFPFGGGPRQCIGLPMAMLEMQLITAMLVQRFRLEVAPGETLRLDPLLTLRPRGGLRMVVRPLQ